MVLISSDSRDENNMRNNFRSTKGVFNSGMIILQFALCIFFILGSLFIYKQFRYINIETGRGLVKDNLLVIKNPWYLKNSRQSFINTLRSIPGIESLTASENVPGIDRFDVWGHPVDSAAISW